MSELKHTPGPWEARDVAGAGLQITATIPKGKTLGVHSYRAESDCDEGSMLYTLRKDQAVTIADERWVQFAGKEWDEMQRANADMIAAAPELLEALEVMVDWYYPVMDSINEQNMEDAKNEAVKAIAKAKGETEC